MAALGLGTLGLGACSSDKGVTKAEFLRRANSSCTHPPKESKAVRRALSNAVTPEQKAKLYREKVLPRAEQVLDEIAKLEPPKADRERVKRFIATARREARSFADVLKSDPRAALALSSQLFAKSSAAANQYGLEICVY